MLDIGKDLGYLIKDEYVKLDGQCVEIVKITWPDPKVTNV